MPWNPVIYNKFKNIRFLPFFDLSDMIQEAPLMKSVDLGCGTGEQTALLVEKFKQATFIGIDSSEEMLEQAEHLKSDRLDFKRQTIEKFVESNESWDLVFSNAALQWADNHKDLFPKLIDKLNPGGQFVVQMPYQPENILNKLLYTLAESEPYRTQFKGWNRPSSVLLLDDYAQIMFDGGLSQLNISQRIYPLIAQDHHTLYEFIAGSALIPYLERLEEKEKALFIEAFKVEIANTFKKLPALYAFKRILLYGKKE
ncbi:methyltransferase domain-containing protein [Myroides sp. WP-1]|uniref:methyltransferase domain-containing protein n=1 Tax=Myroides sp. WP-1 TaxID=2759944 RepID=UPI0015FCF956|nr:methyltransferase domain-containing protein [Myroides sp. WP-1]MBB1140086.1 methyltransferase domain-containing protein [Myroides sp. WP-1]